MALYADHVDGIGVSGTPAGGVITVQFPAAAVALADNLANPTPMGVGAYELVYDPTTGLWLRKTQFQAISSHALINGNSKQVSVPAAGAQATITFAATAGKKWVVDSVMARLMGRGTADIQLFEIVDNATQKYAARMSVTATTGDKDETRAGPGMGLVAAAVNTNMIVRFGAAPAAANFETVTATAFLV